MNIYKERNLRNGCAGLFLYVLQSNGFESFFNGRLRLSFDKLIIRCFQHICMRLVCVLRTQTEFCLKLAITLQ